MKKQSKKEIKDPVTLDGLDQSFVLAEGTSTTLRTFLTEGDWYTLKKPKSLIYIINHNAIKRIAEAAGISKNVEYTILTQPSVDNNYTYLIQCRITDGRGRITVDLGESNRANLNSKGRNNPANMSQKRAFDRAVFNHLNINGVLGEDELQEPEEEMDKLSLDEQKAISPLINLLFAVKKKPDLIAFKAKMAKEKVGYSEAQLEVLRNLYKKKLAEQLNSF